MRRALLATGVLLASMAAACGGGGGAVPTTTPLTSPVARATDTLPQSAGPSWFELAVGTELPPGDLEYVVDWRNRSVSELKTAEGTPASRARILAWTPDGKAVVVMNGDLYAARPAEPFVRFLPAYPVAKEAVIIP